jgi:hypothetical protein
MPSACIGWAALDARKARRRASYAIERVKVLDQGACQELPAGVHFNFELFSGYLPDSRN